MKLHSANFAALDGAANRQVRIRLPPGFQSRRRMKRLCVVHKAILCSPATIVIPLNRQGIPATCGDFTDEGNAGISGKDACRPQPRVIFTPFAKPLPSTARFPETLPVEALCQHGLGQPWCSELAERKMVHTRNTILRAAATFPSDRSRQLRRRDMPNAFFNRMQSPPRNPRWRS